MLFLSFSKTVCQPALSTPVKPDKFKRSKFVASLRNSLRLATSFICALPPKSNSFKFVVNGALAFIAVKIPSKSFVLTLVKPDKFKRSKFVACPRNSLSSATSSITALPPKSNSFKLAVNDALD